MGSSTYRFSVNYPPCDKQKIINIVVSYGFEKEEDDPHSDCFSKEIRGWRPMKYRIDEDEITLLLEWMGSSTTETYFDYLIHCGMVTGRIMSDIYWNIEEGNIQLKENEQLKKGDEEDGSE